MKYSPGSAGRKTMPDDYKTGKFWSYISEGLGLVLVAIAFCIAYIGCSVGERIAKHGWPITVTQKEKP